MRVTKFMISLAGIQTFCAGNGFVRMVHIIFGFHCTMHTISVDAISLLFIHLKCIALVFVAIVVYVMLSFICKLNIWIWPVVKMKANMETLTHETRNQKKGCLQRSSIPISFKAIVIVLVLFFVCLCDPNIFIKPNSINVKRLFIRPNIVYSITISIGHSLRFLNSRRTLD